jgi:hypothetical protein
MTTVVVSPTLFAADTDAEAVRRDFVEPENRAEKFRQPDAYFPYRVAMPGNNVLQLPRSELADEFEVTYELEGNTYTIDDFNERTRTHR